MISFPKLITLARTQEKHQTNSTRGASYNILDCVCVQYTCVLSCVPRSVTPWTVATQSPVSGGFSRQEYWSGLPFPSPRDLPNPGFKPVSPALAGRFFITCPPGKPCILDRYSLKPSKTAKARKSLRRSLRRYND